MKTIFDLCRPREDVLEGRIRDEEFAADLSKVVRGTAVAEYADPALFFHYTYPTRGLKALLESVCRRLSGAGGELNSVIRLDTQYGGGKTHSLIALVHAVRGMGGVGNIEEFIDPAFLPQTNVRIAALSGEDSDPASGLTLEDGLMARSLWGEMAYRLAGRAGFERIRKSDELHIAPGSPTIAELFGDEPTLILIDEVSLYLRKAAGVFHEAANQFTAFLHSLIQAVASTPRAALVCTLAVGSDDQKATDAYANEHLLAVKAFDEAKNVVSRKLLQIDPTQEDETVGVVQRRLFEFVDRTEAETVIEAYADIWKRNRETLSPDAASPETRDQFRMGYPLHPETLNVMTEKMSSLATFQRTRGMLRLLARTVELLWKERPADAYAIHPHHIDPGHGPIRSEFLTKLGQSAYAPALSSDIAAVKGKERSTAQWLDGEMFPHEPPVTSYVARTIFAHTMAYVNAQGLPPEHLRYAVCSPAIEPATVEKARLAFVQESLYLDDRPGAPLRFQVEPNLNQIIKRAMKEIEGKEVRAYLDAKIKELFKGRKTDFEMVAFPGGPAEIADDISSGRPRLILLHYDAQPVAETHPSVLPHDLVRMATKKGVAEELRLYLNHLVFLAADQKRIENMKFEVRYRLALELVQNGPVWKDLQDYQQNQVRQMYGKSAAKVSWAIFQCYRHLFFPSDSPVGGGDAKLGHTAIELPNTADDPGRGQPYIQRALKDQKKLLDRGDQPDSPNYVRDQTQLRNKGEMSVSNLLAEYRKITSLCILMDTNPLVECIRNGIDGEIFIFRKGDQVWGKGDPAPTIDISDNAFVLTLEHAKEKGLWPRPEKKAEKGPEGEDKPNDFPQPEDSEKPGGAVGEDDPKETSKKEALLQEGPLRKALTQIFEDARETSISGIELIQITFFEFKGAWTLQQSLGTFRNAEVSCELDAKLAEEGIDLFDLKFQGNLQKASAIKTFMEPRLRAAKEHTFKAIYSLRFDPTIGTETETSESLIETLTKFGGAEAMVEAFPEAPKEA